MGIAISIIDKKPGLTPVATALDIIEGQCSLQPAETLPAANARARVLAAPVRSRIDLPPFDNSAMDGFALRVGARPIEAEREFDVCCEQAAGDPDRSVPPETACEIMTGARMPQGMDSIIPIEQVRILARHPDARPARIRLLADLPAGRHLRVAGGDVAAGQTVLPAGARLEPADLMLLAALGCASVQVRQRPRIALLCTGRELIDDPGHALGDGEIHNANASWLRARIEDAGGQLVHYETVPDLDAEFGRALTRSLDHGAQIVISTGAVSMGRYDFVPRVLEGEGARILFHKLAMRPGKPLLFARLAQGALYFGLPGNPVSAVVGFRFFVEAALRRMLGLPRERAVRLPLLNPTGKAAGNRVFLKARLGLDAEGRLGVEILPGQESWRIRPLGRTQAWAALPEQGEAFEAGDPVDVFPLGHESPVIQGVPLP